MKHKFVQLTLHITLSLIFLLGIQMPLAAQQEYVDHKPQYRKWQDSYILDKIEYTKNRTIFYFRFVCRSGQGISAIFYPPGGESPWYLKVKDGRAYELKAIKNIRRNGELLSSHLRSRAEYRSLEGFGYTAFSCEVHFERLPNDIKVVDLIEGRGYEYNQNHFNCFEVNVKTWDDPSLGKIADSEKNIDEFEKKFGVNSKPKVKPKVVPKDDPKPEPKKEDPIAKVDPPKDDPKENVKPKDDPKPKPNRNNKANVPGVSDAKDIVCGQVLVLNNLQFQDGTTDFKGMIDCKRAMRAVYEYMRDNPKATVAIMGHTDIFGPKDRNMKLSHDRAYKVMRYISMMGIQPERFKVENYGPTKPLIADGDPVNRRVEIKVTCK